MPRDIPKISQKRLLRLISARADVDYATEAYYRFKAVDEDGFRYNSFISMIITYARPFTNNHGLGSLLCEYPDFPDSETSELKMCHSRLIDIRNKFVGHSSLEGTKVVIMSKGAIAPGSLHKVDDFSWNVAKLTFLKEEFVDWLFIGVDHLRNKLNLSIKEVLGEIGSTYLDDAEVRWLDTLADDFEWSIPATTETEK